MRTTLIDLGKRAALSLAMVASIGLYGSAAANADSAIDPMGPAAKLAHEAVLESGLCIARYAQTSDDVQLPAYVVSKRASKHCALEISRAAGLATFMGGRPELYATNLAYINETLTLNTILRLRKADVTHS